jgi:glucokinase
MALIGVDIGGTKISVGVLVGEPQHLVSKIIEPTPQAGWQAVLDQVVVQVQELRNQYPKTRAVGVGVPGPPNFAKGEVRFAPNIPGFVDVPLVSYLNQKLGLPIALENDANAAGLAEAVLGAAKGTSSSIFITVSTGIGGGICIRDRVWHGHNGIAGEIGHVIALQGGASSGVGQSGALEALASGRAIARDVSFALGREISTKEAFELAQAGNSVAKGVVDNALHFIGRMLGDMQKVFDPEVFVLGGGVAEVGQYFFDRVQAAADHSVGGFAPVQIRRAQMGYDAGVIGAALSARP